MSDIKTKNVALSDDELQQQVQALSKELSPERDLWRGIEHAIEFQQSKKFAGANRLKPLAWAASVMVAVLLGWGSYHTKEPVQVAQQLVPHSAIVTAMEKHFSQEKQALLVSLGQPNLSQLPADMQKQLNELIAARAQLQKALSSDPTNTDLLNLLQWLQQQELSLLDQLYRPKWQTI